MLLFLSDSQKWWKNIGPIAIKSNTHAKGIAVNQESWISPAHPVPKKIKFKLNNNFESILSVRFFFP